MSIPGRLVPETGFLDYTNAQGWSWCGLLTEKPGRVSDYYGDRDVKSLFFINAKKILLNFPAFPCSQDKLPDL